MKNNEITTKFSAPFGSHQFNSLDIRVTHAGNGINYFSGERYAAGHRLSFSPCTETPDKWGVSKQYILMSGDQWESGFHIKLDSSPRKNPHYVKRAMAALIKDYAVVLTSAFELKDSGQLHKIAAEINQAAFKSPSKAKAAKPAVEMPKMTLLTKGLLDRFAAVGSQQEVEDPIVIAKFFNPTGGQTWYATEYDPAERMFFGYVSLFNDHNDEWGYFSLTELEAIMGPLGLGIERDRHFGERPFSSIKSKVSN